MKALKFLIIGFFISVTGFSQSLCPPAYLDAYFFNEEVFLSWVQTEDYGDVLYDECFPVCSLAIGEMDIVNDVDNGTGGWFRYSDSTAVDCGEGMSPCDDGGDDDFSAFASYTQSDTIPIDSRLISETIDLTNYTAAYIEFIETYTYSEDANDSNMVEVSTDGGETWAVVYSSLPLEVEDDIWFNTVDISQFAGNEIKIAFRYYDSAGYGEGWFVDEISVSGSESADYAGCGTFQNYNIYVDGVLAGSTEESWYTVTGLENGTEYCFEVKAVYDEGESEAGFGACSTPMGPFQVNPLAFNFDELSFGEYQEAIMTIENFDTLSTSFEITSIELANIDAALDVLTDPMEVNFSAFSDPSASGFIPGVWGVSDSGSASSTYVPYPQPEDGGDFAFVNDDAIGDGADSTDAWLISDEVSASGYGPYFLLADIFFPNPTGPCGPDQAAYADEFKIHVSVDDGDTWALVDSTMETGVWYWASYMYNLTQHIGDATSFKVAFQYHDCGGEWGYGVAIDNIAIKEGDDFTWLTVSPYKGTAVATGNLNDSISVQIGVYGTDDNFTIAEDIVVASDNTELTVQIGVGVEVAIDESGLTPFEFALHQNYPNPFNPETKIQIDVAEKSHVTVSIFNIMGQKVATLVNGTMDMGIYQIKWSGLSDQGNALPSGMYFYEMKSATYHSVKKLVLVK
ncbi:choice-of-anchor J domain-containing protein [Candidatus Marinimicrobia bacterium]|nr:choice-of-anchor J domain-containing protein [Candidatus Neomarinimicrobiota bacterium]